MKKLFYSVMVLALLFGGCAHENKTGKEKQESYKTALEDSVRNIMMEIDSCNNVAATLGDKINNLLPEFRAVNKAREVEGYMIFQGWESRYPLTSTGVVARLSDSRQIELVAALQGGEFDRIRVSVPSNSAETDVVPYDQALNYRQGGLNTVLFTGENVDKVLNLIADNELNPITVTFLNNGKTAGTWKMGNDFANMISMTYLLYASNREQKELHNRALMLGEKLKILRAHQNAQPDSLNVK